MPTLLALAAVATMYTDTGLMYCGDYSDAMSEPWVALPVSQHGDAWQCGDLVHLLFEDGTSLLARALDAGPFGDNCVMVRDTCVPIVVDVPQEWAPFGGLSCGVRVYNVTAEARKVEAWRQ